MRRISIVIYLLWSIATQAQILDTSSKHLYRPADVTILSEDHLILLSDSTYALDTALNRFTTSYPVYRNSFPFIDQGLEGSSLLRLNGLTERRLFANLGPTDRSAYLYTDSMHIYQTKRPFTRASYSQGPNEMLKMEIVHAQQISKRLSFGVDYRRIKNHNFYYSSLSNANTIRMSNLFNARFYTGYYTPDRKYEILAGYLWNKSRNVETGGLSNPERFASLVGRNKLNNNTPLMRSAFGSEYQNRFSVYQYFRPDGASTDSSLRDDLAQFSKQYFIKTSLSSNRLEFEDQLPDSTLYGFPVESYLDSVMHRSLQNEVGMTVNTRGILLIPSLVYAFDHLYNNGSVSNYNHVYAKLRLVKPIQAGSLSLQGYTGLTGYNAGDRSFEAVGKRGRGPWTADVRLRYQAVEASFLEQQLNATGANWINDLNKVQTLHGSALGAYQNKGFSVGLRPQYEQVDQLIYFTSDTALRQYANAVHIFKLQGHLSLHTKHLKLETEGLYQHVSEADILPRPTWSGWGNAYTDFHLFGKKLFVQLGVRSYIFSAFNAPKYNAITRQWHLTDSAFTMTPPINPYFNTKIKSFNLGVELFHAQMGLNGSDYFSSPGYAVMPRSIRLHIRWDLSN